MRWNLFLSQTIQERSPEHTVSTCMDFENRQRNRYANILCCKSHTHYI